MTDLFDKRCSTNDAAREKNYGLAGDMKKTQYVLKLLGHQADADTLKCIITAVEQGMEMDCGVIDMANNEQESEDYLSLSEYGMTPCVREADYTVSGPSGILAFIDKRGLGYNLAPKNVFKAAEQDYWVDIACSDAGPRVKQLVEECIYKVQKDSSYQPSKSRIENIKQELAVLFDALNKQLQNTHYIVGKDYTWADVHWTAYAHLCEACGLSELIQQRPHVAKWFSSIKNHKSHCGQNAIAYRSLPSLEEMKSNKIKSIVITDF